MFPGKLVAIFAGEAPILSIGKINPEKNNKKRSMKIDTSNVNVLSLIK